MRSLLLSLLLSLLAAELTAQPEGQSKVVICSFLYWDGIPEETLYYRLGDEYHPMEFRRNSRAGTISLKRMANFEVFRREANLDGGSHSYELLASTAVPGHVNEAVFLIIVPDGAEGGEYRVVAMNDSIAAFPRATFLFFNLSEKMITVNFSDENQTLKAGKVSVMQSKVGKKGGFMPCIITDEKGDRIYENRFFSQPTARKIVFISESKKKAEMISVKVLNQLLPHQ